MTRKIYLCRGFITGDIKNIIIIRNADVIKNIDVTKNIDVINNNHVNLGSNFWTWRRLFAQNCSPTMTRSNQQICRRLSNGPPYDVPPARPLRRAGPAGPRPRPRPRPRPFGRHDARDPEPALRPDRLRRRHMPQRIRARRRGARPAEALVAAPRPGARARQRRRRAAPAQRSVRSPSTSIPKKKTND